MNHLYMMTKPFPPNKLTKYMQLFTTRLYYFLYDLVIFYSESTYNTALEMNLIAKNKASWANNTVDTNSINEIYKFHIPERDIKSLLLIGRLEPYRRIDDYFKYLEEIKKEIPDIRGDIIGGGIEENKVIDYCKKFKNITYHGRIEDEYKISKK